LPKREKAIASSVSANVWAGGDGVEGGEDDGGLGVGLGCGLGGGGLGLLLFFAVEVVEEELEGGLWLEAAELGGWGERAEGGVEGDLVDGVGGAATFFVLAVFL
jgi:hypothetical protein